jgi:hypothetical protein
MPGHHPDLLRQFQFPDCIVTGDESRVFQYDPQTKRQNMQWTKAQIISLAKVRDENHADHIFGKQDVIHKEFVPEGQRVNSAFCVGVIGRLLKRISRVRPQFRAEGSWFCLHDNASSHSAMVVKIFLAKHGVLEISHPPYSPDLAP